MRKKLSGKRNIQIIEGLYAVFVIASLVSGINISNANTQVVNKKAEPVMTAGIARVIEEDSVADIETFSIPIVKTSQIETESITEAQEEVTEAQTEPVTEAQTEPVTEAQEEVMKHYYYAINEGGIYSSLSKPLQDYLWKQCKKYGMTNKYKLLLAQMFTESGYDANCISETNDYGLMQINSCNHEWLSEQLGITDFLDPYQSIEAGCYIMSNNYNKYDIESALVAYNMGAGAVRRGIYSSDYSRRVLANLDKLEIMN